MAVLMMRQTETQGSGREWRLGSQSQQQEGLLSPGQVLLEPVPTPTLSGHPASMRGDTGGPAQIP